MQPEAYYCNNVSVIPVEGLTRKELFDGIEIKNWGHYEKEPIEIRAGQEETIRRLQRWIPAFIDETVQAAEYQIPNIFHETNYDVLLPSGRVKAKVSVHDDLGAELLGSCLTSCLTVAYPGTDKRKEISDKFRGISGVIIQGNYHWGGNEGKGLQLGRFNDKSWFTGFSNNVYSMAFERAINSLCRGIDLTEEVVRAESPQFSTPLCYVDGTNEIDTLVRDVSLEVVKAADQPIGEFMAWMQENAAQVNTMGELVRLAVHSYLAAERHDQRAQAGRVVATLPAAVYRIGDKYLELAQRAAAELRPPQNNRMDYLVQ